MGSYGDRSLQCTWCGTWGKCMIDEDLPIGTPGLIDIDGIGVLCDPCYYRGYPPHYDWVQNLLKTKFGQAAPEIASTITEYTFQRCATYKQSLELCEAAFDTPLSHEM